MSVSMLFKQCQLACFQACLLQIDFPISYQEDYALDGLIIHSKVRFNEGPV